MLRIRLSQLHALEAEPVPREIGERLVAHLREYFPQRAAELDAAELDVAISTCTTTARGFGLTRESDLLRLVSLSAALGWGFLDEPEYAGMRRVLEDPRYGPPSDRLRHLVRASLRKLEVEAHNRRLREQR